MSKSSRPNFDTVFGICVVILCALTFFAIAYPLYFVVIASISSPELVNQGKVFFIPRGVSAFGYQQVLDDARIWTGYRNTILYSVLGVAINMTLTLPAAYSLSVRQFRARNAVMGFFVFTMFFSGGLIPTFMLIRDLKMYDTIWALVIPFSVNVYNMIITRTFFQTSVPYELYESASIDGCSHFRYFAMIVLPLSKAVISVIMLYYLVGHWNNFFSALIYINSDSKQPLQIILRSILLQNEFSNDSSMSMGIDGGSYRVRYAEQIKYCLIIVSSLPVLCVYPFIQKYFAKGVMIGALKG